MKALLLEDDIILSKEIISFLKSMNIDCDAVFDFHFDLVVLRISISCFITS